MKRFGIISTLIVFLLAACGGPASDPPGSAPAVLASNTFLADITRNLTGDRLRVDSLLPIGTDPHSYQPTPQDVAKIERSKLLIVNGRGGNRGILEALTREMCADFRLNIATLHLGAMMSPDTAADMPEIHAGKDETSLMLVLAPELVRRDAISALEPFFLFSSFGSKSEP